MSCYDQFAYFGAKPLFDIPKPLGCLYRPDIEKVLDYSRIFFSNQRYSNDGELAKILEGRLAELHNVEHVVLFANGFLAILLTINALSLPNKKEVIVPSLGYRKLDDIIAWAGLVPRYCDVDEDTLTANVDSVKNAITDDTALILIQHSSIGSVDVDAISAIAKKYNIPVVNDSALYFGKINGKMVGSGGNAEVFLLNSTKFINGFEGGYVTTNDEKLSNRLAAAKRFGFNEEDRVALGESLNAKLNEMHAAAALAFLDDIDHYIDDFDTQYLTYKQVLHDIDGIKFVTHKVEGDVCFRDMGMMIKLLDSWPLTREETIKLLNAEKILARSYYFPLHLKDVSYERIIPELPITDAVYSKLINLPQGAHVSVEDIRKIGAFLKKIQNYGRELSVKLRGLNNGNL